VSFDSYSVEYASHSTCIASLEAYLSHLVPFSDKCQKRIKYASGEEIQVECEAYSTLHETNGT
jgi:hypothetical protein